MLLGKCAVVLADIGLGIVAVARVGQVLCGQTPRVHEAPLVCLVSLVLLAGNAVGLGAVRRRLLWPV
jgi:hypothetical protein